MTDDPLAHAILPALLHRLNNATQILSSLSALVALDERGEVLAARADDLAYASRQVDELGWVLALVGSACGAEVLLARRERAGLTPLVACVRDCLRRNARSLAPERDPLPELAPHVADGWQLPWRIGTWLWISARALDPGAELAWQLHEGMDRARLTCRAPWTEDHAAFALALRERLPDARCASGAIDGASECSFEFPAEWFSSRNAP